MENLAEKLDDISRTLEKILWAMRKSQNKVMLAFILVGLFVSALGIANIASAVLRWFMGG